MELSPLIVDALARLEVREGALSPRDQARLDSRPLALRKLIAMRWPEGATWADPEAPFTGIRFVSGPPHEGDAPFFALYPDVWKLAETSTGFELWLDLADDESGDPAITWRDVSEDTSDFEAKEEQGRWFALSELLASLVREP